MTGPGDDGLVYACLTHVPLTLDFPDFVTPIYLGEAQGPQRLNLRDLAPEWEPHHSVLGSTAGAFALKNYLRSQRPEATLVGVCQYRKFVSRRRITAVRDPKYRVMDVVAKRSSTSRASPNGWRPALRRFSSAGRSSSPAAVASAGLPQGSTRATIMSRTCCGRGRGATRASSVTARCSISCARTYSFRAGSNSASTRRLSGSPTSSRSKGSFVSASPGTPRRARATEAQTVVCRSGSAAIPAQARGSDVGANRRVAASSWWGRRRWSSLYEGR